MCNKHILYTFELSSNSEKEQNIFEAGKPNEITVIGVIVSLLILYHNKKSTSGQDCCSIHA